MKSGEREKIRLAAKLDQAVAAAKATFGEEYALRYVLGNMLWSQSIIEALKSGELRKEIDYEAHLDDFIAKTAPTRN